MHLIEVHHFRWCSSGRVQCFVLGHSWWMGWVEPAHAAPTVHGGPRPSPCAHTAWSSHRCFLVKLTSVRYPLESLPAAPCCFPLSCKCKPGSNALSSQKSLIGCRRWLLTQTPTLPHVWAAVVVRARVSASSAEVWSPRQARAACRLPRGVFADVRCSCDRGPV